MPNPNVDVLFGCEIPPGMTVDEAMFEAETIAVLLAQNVLENAFVPSTPQISCEHEHANYSTLQTGIWATEKTGSWATENERDFL